LEESIEPIRMLLGPFRPLRRLGLVCCCLATVQSATVAPNQMSVTHRGRTHLETQLRDAMVSADSLALHATLAVAKVVQMDESHSRLFYRALRSLADLQERAIPDFNETTLNVQVELSEMDKDFDGQISRTEVVQAINLQWGRQQRKAGWRVLYSRSDHYRMLWGALTATLFMLFLGALSLSPDPISGKARSICRRRLRLWSEQWELRRTLGLGMFSELSQQRVSSNFRKLALKSHPDRNRCPSAVQKFDRLCRARDLAYKYVSA